MNEKRGKRINGICLGVIIMMYHEIQSQVRRKVAVTSSRVNGLEVPVG